MNGLVPGIGMFELKTCLIRVELEPQEDGQPKWDEAGDQREPAMKTIIFRQEQHHQRSQRWYEQDQDQDVGENEIHECLCQKEVVQQTAHDEKDDKRKDQVMLDAPGLDRAKFHAAPPGKVSRTIAKEFIDHRDVEIIAHGRTESLSGWTKEVQDAVDQS